MVAAYNSPIRIMDRRNQVKARAVQIVIREKRGEYWTTTTYDAANQLRHSLAAARRTTYTFDAAGNQQLIQEPTGDRTTTVWDFENQPTLYRLRDVARVTMAYNADFRRVTKQS